MSDKNKQLDQYYNLKAEVARLIGGQFGGYPFTFTKRIPFSALAAQDSIYEILSDDVLNQYGQGASLKVYLQSIRAMVDGATAWTAGQTIMIEDNKAIGDSPVAIAQIATNDLTANAKLLESDFTLQDAFYKNSGATAGKGIRARLTSAGPVAAGSELVLTVSGVIR